MTPTASRHESLRVQAEGDRLVIPVPCRYAEAAQTRLQNRGIGTTLCLVPYTDDARLEVWPGLEAARVQEALDTLDD